VPWKAKSKVDMRYELLQRLHNGERATDLAREYGVSRKTIYKFRKRLQLHGIEGLRDRSRRPHRLARKLPEQLEQAVLAIKAQHPTWGAKKIRAALPQHYPGMPLPACSTIHKMLLRAGKVRRRPRRRPKGLLNERPLQQPAAPNELWAADFKGQFQLRNGKPCFPLTVSDVHSRMLLLCEALSSTEQQPVIDAFWALFQEHGLPYAIRTDNGVPFASTANWGLSRLTVLWMRLGIRVERIQPGKPQQNGRHERIHRTLKAHCIRPAAEHLLAQQDRFERFLREYNHQRPHEALDFKTPFECYRPSTRPCPKQLPTPSYPLADRTLHVCSDGRLSLAPGHRPFLAKPLAGQLVGLQELHDGSWLIGFANYDLGIYHPNDKSFQPFSPLRASSLAPSCSP